MKKIVGVSLVIVFVLFGILGITYSYEYNISESLIFDLNGPYEMELELGSEYIEYGITVIKNGIDISNEVNINNSALNVFEVGEYKVKYEILVDGNIEYIYRKVNVLEYVKPVIKLLGEEIIYLDVNGIYQEPGYEVSDNYDTDLYDNVIITNNLDVSKIGEYKIEYSVVDSSNNMSVVSRKIVVR